MQVKEYLYICKMHALLETLKFACFDAYYLHYNSAADPVFLVGYGSITGFEGPGLGFHEIPWICLGFRQKFSETKSMDL